ncbi:MAG: endolytic transglycosylase MltG [Thermoanaerobaculia bacterium]
MRRLLLWATAIVLLLALVAGAAGWLAWQRLQQPFKGYTKPRQRLVIAEGASARRILAELEEQGVIADARLARLYLIHVLDDPPLQAGEYRFEGELTTPQALDRLIRGDVVRHAVTVVEGRTLEQTAQALAATGLVSAEALLAAMRRPERIRDLDPEAEDLEGYLFPDTYHFTRNTDAETMVDTMVDTFRRRLEEEVLPRISEVPAPPPRELVTLASLVESEAAVDGERGVIAGVYRNRLDRGIALYADPTVIFALRRAGRWDGNLTRSDLQFDSPYNTYRYSGLPPGPICSPGLASLQAAAQPADVPFLYFVSRNDGTHVFAETLSEHNRNVARWQKEYWRRERQATAEPGGSD